MPIYLDCQDVIGKIKDDSLGLDSSVSAAFKRLKID